MDAIAVVITAGILNCRERKEGREGGREGGRGEREGGRE